MPVFRSYTVLYNFRDKYIFLGHAVGCLQPGKRHCSIFFILSSLFCYIEKILWTTQNCVESTGQTHKYSYFKEFVLRKRLTEARNSKRKPTKNPFNRENFTEEEMLHLSKTDCRTTFLFITLCYKENFQWALKVFIVVHTFSNIAIADEISV